MYDLFLFTAVQVVQKFCITFDILDILHWKYPKVGTKRKQYLAFNYYHQQLNEIHI